MSKWCRHLGSALLYAGEGQVIKPLHSRDLASVVPLQELLEPPAHCTAFDGAARFCKLCHRAPCQLQSPQSSSHGIHS